MIQAAIVHGLENSRNHDSLWTAFDAVSAVCTGDAGQAAHLLRRLFQERPFILCQRLAVVGGIQIILHLRQIRHAAEHRQNAGQPQREPQRPGRLTGLRISRLQELRRTLGKVDQISAPHRFHHDNRLGVCPCNFIAFPGLHRSILPVHVVDLELYKINVAVRGQHLLEAFCFVVERKPEVADLSFLLLFLHKVPEVIILIEMRSVLAEVVKQIIVEVACSGAPQRCLKHLLRLLFTLREKGRELGGEIETVSGIAVHQRLLHRGLRLSVVVTVSRIKIIIAAFHEQIDHLLHGFDIDFFVLHRQTHEPEAQPADVRNFFVTHCFSFLYFHDVSKSGLGNPVPHVTVYIGKQFHHHCGNHPAVADRHRNRILSAVPVRPHFQPVEPDQLLSAGRHAAAERIAGLPSGRLRIARFIKNPAVKLRIPLHLIVGMALKFAEPHLLQFGNYFVLPLPIENPQGFHGSFQSGNDELRVVRNLRINAFVTKSAERLSPLRGQRNVNSAVEPALQVPLCQTVTQQNQSGHHYFTTCGIPQ